MLNIIIEILRLFSILLIHDLVGVFFYSWVVATNQTKGLTPRNRAILRFMGTVGLYGAVAHCIYSVVLWVINLF